MKKKITSVIGTIALILGAGLNLQYSLDDYGLKANHLSTFVLAQSSSSGGGSGSSSGSSGWFWTLIKTGTECTYTSGGVSGSISGGVSGGVSGGENVTITYKGSVWECYDGWNPFCSKDCRAPI